MRRVRGFYLLLVVAALCSTTVGAQSRETLWFSFNAGADFPLLGATRYLGTGPEVGFLAGARLPFFSFLTSEVEIGSVLLPIQGGSSLTGLSAVGRAGLEFPPGGRLSGRLYGLGGYLQGIIIGAAPSSQISAGSILGGGGLSAGFRFLDSWSLVASVEAWTAVGLGPFIRGSVGARFHPVVRGLKPLAYELKALSGLKFSGLSVNALFPVLYRYYEKRPLGRVTIANTSDKAITDLRVSFLVEDYMDTPMPCPSVARLAPGDTADIDLFALFSEQVLENTESVRVTAKVTFDYTVEVWKLHQEAAVPMSLYARNEITWEDDRRAAAFVTTRDPVVLQFGRNTATWVEAAGSDAVNWKLRMAMGVFEALRLYGMTYVVDPSLPYDMVSEKAGAVDFLQFPRETLLYSTGDCDDLSILYCSLLQSLDIDTAFVTVPGHIFAAVSLGVSPEEARRVFSRPDDLIYENDTAWLPVEITALSSTFVEAWATGAAEWRQASAGGKRGFFPVRKAWEEYKPVGIAAKESTISMPSSIAFEAVYGRALAGYVAQEILPLVRDLKAAIAKARDKPPAINRLGVMYARYGLNEEALEQFNQALKLRDYIPTMVNKANLLFLEGTNRDALNLYQKVLTLQPDAPGALLGVARCYHALKNYGRVAEPFNRLKMVSPDLAARFPYLDPGGTGTTRAADVAGTTRYVAWDYGE